MSRYHSYISTAASIIESYKGNIPFAIFIKQFFSANKKYGSRDRRQIAALCYQFFRIGNMGKTLSLQERITMAAFICEAAPTELLEKLNPEWNAAAGKSIAEKISMLQLDAGDIFHFENELSPAVDKEKFALSFLQQPDVFLRMRPANHITTEKKLHKLKDRYKLESDDCIRLQQGTNVEDVLVLDKEVVVQDMSSQHVLDFLKTNTAGALIDHKEPISVWDCCAASGGKSILLVDVLHKKIDLTVSDIRASIVLNLHHRFKKAGIKQYKYFISDLGNTNLDAISSNYDIVICDAPCSGSGTWSRTPEQLHTFKNDQVDEYAALQKKIVTNVVPHLHAGGLFFYITCSAFKKENEEVADFITTELNCELLEQKILAGYESKADSMFAAVFKKL